MEDFRAKPSSWYVVGWMPVVYKDKSNSPGQGYDCDSTRNITFTTNAGNSFFASLIPTAKTPASSYSTVVVRQERLAIQLEPS